MTACPKCEAKLLTEYDRDARPKCFTCSATLDRAYVCEGCGDRVPDGQACCTEQEIAIALAAGNACRTARRAARNRR